MVAGDDDDPQPGRAGIGATAAATSGRGGSSSAISPSERELRARRASRSSPRRPLRVRARRRRARASPVPHSARKPARSGRGRPRSSGRSPWRAALAVQRSSSSSGRALGVDQARHRARRRSSSSASGEGRSGTAAHAALALGLRPLTSLAERAAATSSALSVGSPCVPPPPTRSSRELLHRIAVRASAENGSPSAATAGPARSISSPFAHRTRRSSSLGERPVLSVQMTSVEPSVSTAVSRLTSARRRAMRRTPTASASVMVGRRPSGTFATRRPIANVTASSRGRPATVVPRSRRRTRRDRDGAISLATLFTCTWSGLSSARTRWVSAAMRPSSVCIPVAKTTASASPAVQGCREHEVVGLEQRAWPARPRAALRVTGCDSPVSGDMSTSTEPWIRRASAESRSPSSIRSDVARDELRRVDLGRLAVAAHAGEGRQVALQRLRRALGLKLLNKREDRVEDDDDDDGDRERHDPADDGEGRGRPEQQGQRVRELAQQVADVARSLASRISLCPYCSSRRAASRARRPPRRVPRCLSRRSSRSSGSIEPSTALSSGSLGSDLGHDARLTLSRVGPRHAGPRDRHTRLRVFWSPR